MVQQVSIEERLYNQLAERAKKRGISSDDYINRALTWYLRQIKKTEAGMGGGVQSMKIISQEQEKKIFGDS